MNKSNHIKSFEIENFKRFGNLKLNDLAQFNLILGDNNVGKTSVLEALLIDDDHYVTINNLAYTLAYRNIKSDKNYTYSDLKFYLKKGKTKGEIKHRISISIETNSYDQYEIEINDNDRKLTFLKNGFNEYEINFDKGISYSTNIPIPYIPFYRGHDTDLLDYYSKYIQPNRDLKKALINSIQTIVPNINNIEVSLIDSSNPMLLVEESNKNDLIPLALYGDGVLKLFRILMELVVHNGKRLMIDEIDTGIHYSRLKEFWRTILFAAKENDVQLFATTHNKECIDYFHQAFKMEFLNKLKEDVRSITLVENNKTKEVEAFTYNFEKFEHAIKLGNEIRGGE